MNYRFFKIPALDPNPESVELNRFLQERRVLSVDKLYLNQELNLEIKPGEKIHKSKTGLLFCGFKVYPGTIKLGSRQRKSFGKHLRDNRKAYDLGLIDDGQLQQKTAAMLGPALFADRLAWRKKLLSSHSQKGGMMW